MGTLRIGETVDREFKNRRNGGRKVEEFGKQQKRTLKLRIEETVNRDFKN